MSFNKKIKLSIVAMLSISVSLFGGNKIFYSEDGKTKYIKIDSRKNFVKQINPLDTEKIYGGVLMTGNTISCVTHRKNASKNEYDEVSRNYNFQCYPEIFDKRGHNIINNYYIIKYLDIDNDNSTYNSSTAYINVPKDFKNIKYVKLAWVGYINNFSYLYTDGEEKIFSSDVKSENIKNIPEIRKVKLKIGNYDYVDIIADQIIYEKKKLDRDELWYNDLTGDFYDGGDFMRRGFIYTSSKDVTELFKKNYNDYFYSNKGKKIPITVGNIFTTIGHSNVRQGNFGVWGLIVIYESDKQDKNSKFRLNKVYYGLGSIYKNKIFKMKINNVIISPNIDPNDFESNKFMSLTAEGETFKKDYDQVFLLYKGKKYYLEDKGEPKVNNNGRLTRKKTILNGVSTRLIDRYPNFNNSNGIDLQIFTNTPKIFKEIQQISGSNNVSFKLEIKSYLDVIKPVFFVLSTELKEPDLCVEISKVYDFKTNKEVKKIKPGRKYRFLYKIKNLSDEVYVDKLSLTMDFDDNFVYVDNNNKTLLIDGYLYRGKEKNIGQNDLVISLKDNGLYFSDKNYNLNRNGETSIVFIGELKNNKKSDPNELIKFYANEKDSLGIERKNLELPLCSKFDGEVVEGIDTGGIVDTMGNVKIIDGETGSSKKIQTKIVNKKFNIDLSVVDPDTDEEKKYSGLIKIDLVELKDKDSSCLEAKKVINSKIVSFIEDEKKEIEYKIAKPYKNLAFKVSYLTYKDNESDDEIEKMFDFKKNAKVCNIDFRRFFQANSPEEAAKVSIEFMCCFLSIFDIQCSDSDSYMGGMSFQVPVNKMCNFMNIFGFSCSNGSNDLFKKLFETFKKVPNENKKVICSDNFAVRPDKFIVEIPFDKMKAGEEAEIKVKAIDFLGSVVKDFNIDDNDYLKLSIFPVNENKHSCKNFKNWDMKIGKFNKGIATVTIKNSETGTFKVTAQEAEGKEFAIVDKKDGGDKYKISQNDFDLKGNGEKTLVRVFPYSLKIISTIDSDDWKYKDISYDGKDSFMDLKISVQALNKDGEVLENYNKDCYSDPNDKFDGVKTQVVHDYKVGNSYRIEGGENEEIFFKEKSKEDFSEKIIRERIGKILNQIKVTNGEKEIETNIMFNRIGNREPVKFILENIEVSIDEPLASDIKSVLEVNKSITFYYGKPIMKNKRVFVDRNKEFDIKFVYSVYDENKDNDYAHLEGKNVYDDTDLFFFENKKHGIGDYHVNVQDVEYDRNKLELVSIDRNFNKDIIKFRYKGTEYPYIGNVVVNFPDYLGGKQTFKVVVIGEGQWQGSDQGNEFKTKLGKEKVDKIGDW